MRIRSLDDGTLLVEERLTLVRFGTAIGALALVAVLAFRGREQGPATREMLGGATGFVVLSALAAWFPDRTFRFEPALQRLTWSKRRPSPSHAGVRPRRDVR